MHSDLAEAIDFHNAVIAEGSKALIGYDTAKALANVVLLSEIPTTYDKSEQRQNNGKCASNHKPSNAPHERGTRPR